MKTKSRQRLIGEIFSLLFLLGCFIGCSGSGDNPLIGGGSNDSEVTLKGAHQ